MQYGQRMKRWIALGMAVSLSFPLILNPTNAYAAKSINELEQGKRQAQSELNQLDSELVNLLADINLLERNIEENRRQIQDVKYELKAARAAEAKQYEDMKVRIRYMYENGQQSIFTMLLESGSIAEFLNRVSYARAVYEYDRGLLSSYEATAEAIHDMQVALKIEQAELVARENDLKAKQGTLNAMIATKRSEIANFDSQLKLAREAAARQAAERARREAEARARANAAAVSRQAEIERRRQEEAARQQQEEAEKPAELAIAQADGDERMEEDANGTTTTSSQSETTEKASDTKSNTKSSDEDVIPESTTTSSKSDGKKKTTSIVEDLSAGEDTEDTSDYVEDTTTTTSSTTSDDDYGDVYDDSDDSEYYDGSSDDSSDYIDSYADVEDTTTDSSASQSTGSTSVSGSSVASYASQFVGNPYVWGGNSLTNGCDCSGFVVQVYSHFGVDLSSTRTSGALEGVGQSVSYENIQPGDIVCYPGHVAIYAGGGRIVEAQSSKTGITSNRSVTNSSITAIRRVL